MNLPNKLTLSRFVLTAGFLVAMFLRFPWHQTAALALFTLAGITDALDGRIARQRRLITNFGILMDPLADKILTCSAFIAFVEVDQMEAWMVVIIVARELAITGLRLLAASRSLVLAAEGFGKHKTISQIVTIVAILLVMARPEWGAVGDAILGPEVLGRSWIEALASVARWTTVGLTLWSGGVYVWRNRELFLRDL